MGPKGEEVTFPELDPFEGVASGLSILATFDPDFRVFANGEFVHGSTLGYSTHCSTQLYKGRSRGEEAVT
jgi:hypothetical protein